MREPSLRSLPAVLTPYRVAQGSRSFLSLLERRASTYGAGGQPSSLGATGASTWTNNVRPTCQHVTRIDGGTSLIPASQRLTPTGGHDHVSQQLPAIVGDGHRVPRIHPRLVAQIAEKSRSRLSRPASPIRSEHYAHFRVPNNLVECATVFQSTDPTNGSVLACVESLIAVGQIYSAVTRASAPRRDLQCANGNGVPSRRNCSRPGRVPSLGTTMKMDVVKVGDVPVFYIEFAIENLGCAANVRAASSHVLKGILV